MKSKAAIVEENEEEKESEEETDEGLDLAHDTEITVSSADDANASSKTFVQKSASHSFVSLVDVFPPLPAKGSFSVETIKKSLYFFS